MKLTFFSRFAVVTILKFIFFGAIANAQEKVKNNVENWTDVPPIISPAIGSKAPSDAIILFDKKDLHLWESVKGKENPVPWKVKGSKFTIEPGTGSIATKQSFSDCQLHVEWKIPALEMHENLRYGNSGVLFMGLYEVQIYSSFNNVHKIYSNGQAGSIYKQYAPMVNACLPPEKWQTFDIIFTAPKFNADKSLNSPAKLTVFQNGVLIQYNAPLKGKTNNTDYTEYNWHPDCLPLILQEHNSRISFRNIWIRKLDLLQ